MTMGRLDRDSSAIDALVCRPAGLSTLDFLQRLPVDGDGPAKTVLPEVRREMGVLARAELSKQRLHAKNAQAVGLDLTRLGLPPDAPEPRERFLPGPVEPRRLVGGAMLRQRELAEAASTRPEHLSLEMRASQSAPALPSRQHVASGPKQAVVAQHKPQRQRESKGDAETQLREEEVRLQRELLRVTRKLCRKHETLLFPPMGGEVVTQNRTSELAARWTKAQREGDAHAQHAALMADRFATQTQLDYCRREPEEPEDMGTNHARRATHSKYGEALARNKRSLRGVF